MLHLEGLGASTSHPFWRVLLLPFGKLSYTLVGAVSILSVGLLLPCYRQCFKIYSSEHFDCPIGRKIRGHRGIPILANSLPTHRNPSRVLSTKTSSSLDRGQSSKMQRRTRSHNEDETLFDLDGFHENKNCEPFFESDDDSSGMLVFEIFSWTPSLLLFYFISFWSIYSWSPQM